MIQGTLEISNSTAKETSECYHCGDSCAESTLKKEDKTFCCQGCLTVFDILSSEGMNEYYCYETKPGTKVKTIDVVQKYKYLDHDEIQAELLDFRSDTLSKVKLLIPQIHCSSCIWLLENLHKLNPAILSSEVNFSNKEVQVNFKEADLSLKEVVLLLSSVGYEPSINLASKSDKVKKDKSIYYKIGIAGFCFGNIMLLSFPEYLGIEGSGFDQHQDFFLYLIFALSLPVVFYCSSDYLSSAINGLANKYINIDVPISLGITVLFLRSSYEIFNHTGAGYLDSLSGLIFFLLIGKWYQSKIYDSLKFDRDYQSYFPIAVNKVVENEEVTTQLKDLKKGDVIVLRNQELIPADATLLSSHANIDYSFVTGESEAVQMEKEALLYAGGRQVGGTIEVKISKEVNQSYLTSLWNQETFQKKNSQYKNIIDVVSKYFTIAILGLSAIATGVWYFIDASEIVNVVSSILIIACPCALALTVPFTLGNAVRLLGKKGLYAKSVDTVEKLSQVNHIVFDKTGTITNPNDQKIDFVGSKLSDEELSAVKSIVKNSAHPLSVAIYQNIGKTMESSVENFKEVVGKGIVSKVGNQSILLGSAEHVEAEENKGDSSRVYLKIGEEVKGYFQFENQLRVGAKGLFQSLKNNFDLHLLSGDSAKDSKRLSSFFTSKQLHFKQSPIQKLNYVEALQSNDNKVLMVGDGLNDAGALKQSDVGIALSDNIYSFSPACDAILSANEFQLIPKVLKYAKSSMNVVKMGFVLSFAYNVVGISLAMGNYISPLTSAILMPLSSVSVVLFSSISSNILAKKHLK